MADEPKVLAGQVALVTGGGRGIGQAIALALAAEGATVAVTARSADQLAETVTQVEQRGGRASAFPMDVIDPQGVQGMVAQVEKALGPIDLLVNNAAAIGPAGPIAETDAASWWRILEVNLRGPFLCCQAVLRGMIARRGGRIVNVSSGVSLSPWPYVSAYAISKTALNRFSETLALETASDHITVFAISPGVVRTAIAETTFSPEFLKWDDKVPRLIAEGHGVPPDRAAQLTVALASGKADVLSGRLISIHDDLEAMIAQAQRIQEDELYVLRLKRL